MALKYPERKPPNYLEKDPPIENENLHKDRRIYGGFLSLSYFHKLKSQSIHNH